MLASTLSKTKFFGSTAEASFDIEEGIMGIPGKYTYEPDH